FVLVGVFLAVTIELCGVSPLSFAVGAYLPLSTTLPIFIGGAIKGIVDRRTGAAAGAHGDEIGAGNLFSTGLVARATVAGVVVALLSVNDTMLKALERADFTRTLTQALGAGGYQVLGVAFFAVMGVTLYRVGLRKL